MTSLAPEKVGPVSEQAVVEHTTDTPASTSGPREPVPLSVASTATGPVEEHPPRSGGSALDRLRPLDAGFPGVPANVAELLRCNNADIDRLAAQTATDGDLMTILKGAFEADWFRAKACLVFDKWPGRGTANFDHAAALRLMTGLTELRGNVHTAVKPLAQARVKTELSDRAAALPGNTKLRGRLSAQQDVPGEQQVGFIGSVGADSVTSDVDVSTDGINSEAGVRAYNAAFRELLGVKKDPGTVFDLNVYAKDFIFGFNEASGGAGKLVIDPKRENSEEPSAPKAAERDREQDVWALVHISRYMPSDKDWEAFVASSLDGLGELDEAKAADQAERLSTARRRSKGFEYRLLSMMEHLTKTLDLGLGKSATTWKEEEAAHYEEGAVRMRAANRLYEDKLLQVKELRLEIEAARAKLAASILPADATQLEALITRLDGELSMAQLYANEVYGSGGATVHAVIGMQMPKNLKKKRSLDAVTAVLPKPQLFQSFNDNLGDVLKDFEHYGKANGHGDPDYWYAAFKMGKYAHRMVDCLGRLADGKDDDIISMTDAAAFADDPHVVALKELADNHLTEKDSERGKDPANLKTHPYFSTMDQAKVIGLRAHAIALGTAVRKKAAIKSPAVAAPVRPIRGADITNEQLAKMAASVKTAMAQARKVKVESAGPTPR